MLQAARSSASIWPTEPQDKLALFACAMVFMDWHQMVMYFTPAGAALLEETMIMLYVCSKVLTSKMHGTTYKWYKTCQWEGGKADFSSLLQPLRILASSTRAKGKVNAVTN